MVGRAHAENGTSMAKEFLPKVACENRITIRDNRLRETTDGVNALHVEESNARSSIRMGKWQEMSKLGHLVDQNPDAIVLT